MGRPSFDVVQLDAVYVDGAVDLDGKLVLLGAVGKLNVLFYRVLVLARVARGADDLLPWDPGALVRQECVASAGGKRDGVVAFGRGVRHRSKTFSRELNLVNMPLNGRLLGCNKVDDVLVQVHSVRRILNFPVAGREHDRVWVIQRGKVGQMVAAVVDDQVDVAIMSTPLGWVGGDVLCLVGDLEPTAIDGFDVGVPDLLASARRRVHEDDAHHVADPVRLLDQYMLTGPDDLSDESVVVGEAARNIYREDVSARYVVELQLDDRVMGAGLGVLDHPRLRVRLLARLGLGAAGPREEVLDGKLGNAGLVGAQEGNVAAVFRPPGGTRAGQNLFLVDPVRHAIEHFGAAIPGDLNDVGRANLAQVQVVVPGEGHGVAGGTPLGKLDAGFGFVRDQGFGGLGLDIENPVGGIAGMAPVGLDVGRDQDSLEVSARLHLDRVVGLGPVIEGALLHQGPSLGHLLTGCPGRSSRVLRADVFHDEEVLPGSPLFQQETILAGRPSNPSYGVDLGAPEAAEHLVERHALPRPLRDGRLWVVGDLRGVFVGLGRDEDEQAGDPGGDQQAGCDEERPAHPPVHLPTLGVGMLGCAAVGEEGAGLEIVAVRIVLEDGVGVVVVVAAAAALAVVSVSAMAVVCRLFELG
ncbi:50cf2f86-0da3-487a-90cb-c2436a1416b1 [Thermothielavioides terrestris]|uniref:50cf2f86-0da3-487a-90cb-c2436a1416b1 n=1 Tax=Thermothielavioides terrestris TaxID=2587410 RepID=A0A3S4ETF8_9PEZI|nr:50cf2f86-0da3-487a-90cb-c2436a1416b1 [Thermothielavioides terrestris]